MTRKRKTQRFEDALERLEKIVETLEKGNLSLEDSMKAFMEGIKLVQFCNQKLEEADKKIEMLVRGSENEWEITSFEQEEGSQGHEEL